MSYIQTASKDQFLDTSDRKNPMKSGKIFMICLPALVHDRLIIDSEVAGQIHPCQFITGAALQYIGPQQDDMGAIA